MPHPVPVPISLKAVIIASAAVLLGGCITHEGTVYRDSARARVEFENEEAARLFYEGLGRRKSTAKASDGTTQISIPVIFEHKRHYVAGDNAVFNDGVRICDTNQDGRITELEARIYVNQLK